MPLLTICPAESIGISLDASWNSTAQKVAAAVGKANRHGGRAEAELLRSQSSPESQNSQNKAKVDSSAVISCLVCDIQFATNIRF